MARRVIIPMTPSLLAQFCTNGERHFRVENGPPADAKFIGAYYDPMRNVFDVCFESDDFENVAEGERYPRLLPVTYEICG